MVVLVQESYIHPSWNHSQRSAFNVALLQLSTASNKAYPVAFSDHFMVQTGTRLTAAGWGSGIEEISLGSEIFGSLKLENQELIQRDQCNIQRLWDGSIPKGVICAVNNEQKASCLVDSGSPLLLLDQPKNDLSKGTPNLDFIVGLNIDGSPCGTPNKPDLFVSLEHIHSWVTDYTSNGI